ncbi:hypothetical protein EOD40_03475 [Flavobacterium sufflavum]|uniref:Signal peptidase n=1 Tax=Flavobacterium sufflavum TaxID=1921138 RepID=A0A3S2V6D2_9FLAO|nr:hypothetical protein [Flavobacterium sufflavum]RVT78309.1 hypothetical protein EOD40_03475 [Flavobacterium sufflavum]
MRKILNNIYCIFFFFFWGAVVFAGPVVPVPASPVPPPPGLPIGDGFLVLFVVGLSFGFYKIYISMKKKKRSI